MKVCWTVLPLALFAAACASTPNAPVNDPSAAAGTAPAPPKEDAARPSGSASARDPKIVALAKPALACPFEDDDFDRECPAVKAWSDNEELFADGKGNETIFSMFADADPKVRALAALHGIDDGPGFFADKDHARRVFELAKSRADADRSLAYYVSLVQADKLGLGKELVALAKHPSKPFRSALSGVITKSQSPSAVATLRALLEDADAKVQEDAIGALSTGGLTPPADPVCTMLQEQMQKPGRLGSAALWAGSSSQCPGMHERVVAELDKRIADPSKVTNAFGIGLTLAAGGVCTRTKSAELKKKGFAVGKKLSGATVPDPNTRRAALSVMVDCDPAAAATALAALATDKDKFVADGAKKAQADLAAKKK